MASLHVQHIFLGCLLAGLVLHGTAWKTLDLLDQNSWLIEGEYVAQGNYAHASTRPFYGYPGTALLLAAQGAQKLGASPLGALRGSITLLSSASIAGITALCYSLRPRTWWWIATAGLLLFNKLYFLATPPSAVAAPALVLACLLAWYLYEHPRAHAGWLLCAGAVMGIAASVRFDITVAISSLLVVSLVPRYGRRIGWVALAAVILFCATNPYMWVMPRQHLTDIITKVSTHYYSPESRQLSLTQFIFISPLALVGASLALAVGVARQVPLLIPRPYLWYLIFVTIVVSTILLTSAYQPRWYFYPLALLWEVLLPLLIIGLLPELRLATRTMHASATRVPWLAQMAVVTLMVSGYVATFLHYYYLPETIFVIP